MSAVLVSTKGQIVLPAAVRKALGLTRVHILGHSWGGALATEYLLTKGQAGVVSVTLSSPLISGVQRLLSRTIFKVILPSECFAMQFA